MSKIDVKGVAVLMESASALANKPTLTSQEQRSYNLLLSQIAMLKTGEVTLDDLNQQMVDESARKHGFESRRINPTRMTSEQRSKAEGWSAMVLKAAEIRTNETQGNILARVGSYSGLGFFSPVESISEVYAAMAAHDAVFDPEAVSYQETANGRIEQIPVYGDIEAIGVPVGEAANTTSSEQNLSAPGAAFNGVYSFRSPLWRVPIEVVQDVEAMGGAIEMFKKFAADRIARGAAAKLMNGSGVGEPLGLIPSLLAAGVTPVSAVGSSSNTGGAETAANSIGSKDIATLYYSLNKAYRNSPKAAFFMSDDTLVYLAQLVNKQGNPLVQWQGPEAFIFGKPVRVAPSMDGIGASKYPVVFGDGSYWLTRMVSDDLTRVQVVKEAAGLIEKGLVGMRMFVRYGGSLLFTDAGSPAPFAVLQNHS